MKRVLVLALIGIMAIITIACGTDDKKDAPVEDKGEEEIDASGEEGPITVKHELGETDVEKNPEKVVVFDFGTLDTLDTLGIEVTGVPHSNMPKYLDKFTGDSYENVGSLKEPDFEAISHIDPDLIIISSRQSPLYDELSELAPTIYLGIDTDRYMESFAENLAIIGEVFAKEDEVEKELATIEESVAALQDKSAESDKNALIILANDDKISAYGENSRFGLIHDVFGVPAVDENIEASTHGMNVTFEYVVEEDPDLLYVIDRGAAIGEGSSAKKIVENKLVVDTKVYKNDDITYLDPEYWYLSGGGIVSVTEMIEEISASLE